MGRLPHINQTEAQILRAQYEQGDTIAELARASGYTRTAVQSALCRAETPLRHMGGRGTWAPPETLARHLICPQCQAHAMSRGSDRVTTFELCTACDYERWWENGQPCVLDTDARIWHSPGWLPELKD